MTIARKRLIRIASGAGLIAIGGVVTLALVAWTGRYGAEWHRFWVEMAPILSVPIMAWGVFRIIR